MAQRVILFDVDGVLIHSYGNPEPEKRRRWFAHLKTDFGFDKSALDPFFRERFADIVCGRTSLIDELADYLPGIGYKGSPLNFVAYWLKNDTQANLSLIDAIRAFRNTGAARFYLATNQEHLRALHLWTTFGLSHLFEDMFFSARLGAAKPDRAFFAAVDALIGPQETPPLFFDDAKANIEAARAHGWEAELFTEVEQFTSHPWIASHLA